MSNNVNENNLYLKVLGPNGEAFHGGRGRWHLPTVSKPGEWMPTIDNPTPCWRGYHVLSDTRQALSWIGPTFWLCEVDGPVIKDTGKCVVGRARLVEQLPWDARAARLFAADCAEDVLSIFERRYPNDDRPRRAIMTARLFANSEATRSELTAAWAAAWDAARAAVGDAARAAARAAVGAAVGDAARAAARDAARASAGAAARDAQAVRLADYLGVEPPKGLL